MSGNGRWLALALVATLGLWGGTALAAVSLGGTSTTEPTPTTVNGFTEVNLSKVFNEQGIIFKGKTGPQGQSLGGGQGWDIEANSFPSTGNFTVSAGSAHPTFLIPSYTAGVNSVLGLGSALTIPVPPGRYTSVWLMYLSEGPANGALQLTYSNGTTASDSFTFSGALANPVNTPQFQAYNFPTALYEGHNECLKLGLCSNKGLTDGTVDPSMSSGVGWIHGYVLTADSSLTLQSVGFPSVTSGNTINDATIFAISLEDAPGFTPGSTAASTGTSSSASTSTSSSAPTGTSSSATGTAAGSQATSTTTPTSSSLPKTGGSPVRAAVGVLLVLAGGVLVGRSRLRRHADASASRP